MLCIEKTVPPKPLGFSYCCPHLHCAGRSCSPSPHKETGGLGVLGRGSKRKRSSLSLSRLGLDASFFLLIDGQLVWKEKKANDTQERERERILDTVGRCYQGEHTHTTTHTLSNSAFLTHISFSIFCGQWRRPPIVSIGRMCAAAVAVVRSSPGPPLIKATHAACECAPHPRDDGHRHTFSIFFFFFSFFPL